MTSINPVTFRSVLPGNIPSPDGFPMLTIGRLYAGFGAEIPRNLSCAISEADGKEPVFFMIAEPYFLEGLGSLFARGELLGAYGLVPAPASIKVPPDPTKSSFEEALEFEGVTACPVKIACKVILADTATGEERSIELVYRSWEELVANYNDDVGGLAKDFRWRPDGQQPPQEGP